MSIGRYTYLFLLLLQLLFATPVASQDIEQVAKAKWITVTGGAGLTGSAYSGFGLQSRRDPFAYTLSTNLNFNIKGVVDAPFSLLYTSQNTTFNVPSYNFVGISPRYKWITAHIGSRNMSMSQFVYSGTTFMGGGVELLPENFIIKGKAFYGRLVKAVLLGDTLSPVIQPPAYERWGGAGMLIVGTQSNNVELILFKGADRISSLPGADSIHSVKPEENLVLGINTKQKIGEHFLFALEYAFSAYTRDMRQPNMVYDNYTYIDNFGMLFRPKASSFYAHAWSVKADYQAEIFTAGVSFQRIDPNYQTMGALYMTNNVQDITVNAATKIVDNKINLSGSFGYQRNNLDNKSDAVDKRFISNFNFSYAITENLNTAVSFSNYNTSTEAVRILVKDSIKYAQINTNFSVNASYLIPGNELKHSFDMSFNMQNANVINNEFTDVESAGNRMTGVNGAYRLAFASSDVSISVNAAVNNNKMASGNDLTANCGVVVSKGFFKKKLQTTLGFTALFSRPDASSSNVNTTRLTLAYRFLKKHSVNMNASYINRNLTSERNGNTVSGEFLVNFAYNFVL